jgi:hypothetical protein
MSEDQKSNFEETRDSLASELANATWSKLPKDWQTPAQFFSQVAVLIEAHGADVEEAFDVLGDENVLLENRVLKTMVQHAWDIVMGYAGFAVAMGQKVGTIDKDGDPTDKMPEGMAPMLAKLNEELAKFRDAYEDFIETGAAPDGPVDVGPATAEGEG